MGMDKDLKDRLKSLSETSLSEEQLSTLRRNIQEGVRNSGQDAKALVRRPFLNASRVAVAAVFPAILVATGIYTVTRDAAEPPINQSGQSAHLERLVPLSGLQMFGTKDGWMVESNQDLLRTTDGGKHWTDVTPRGLNPASSKQALVSSGTSAYVVVGTVRSQHAYTTIFRTNDGGLTWTKTSVNLPDSEAKTGLLPDAVMFSDKDHGWLSTQLLDLGLGGSSPGPLYRTENGGNKWSLASRSLAPNTVGFHWLYFINGYVGFTEGAEQVSGADPGETNTNPERLYSTSDGGLHWIRSTIELPTGKGVNIYQPTFFSSRSGMIPVVKEQGQYHEVYFYTSHNAGRDWKLSGSQNVSQPKDNLVIDILDDQHWWFYWGGRIYSTSNAGRKFVSEKVSISNLTSLDFINDKLGYAIVNVIGTNGETGVVYKTMDGGKHWTKA